MLKNFDEMRQLGQDNMDVAMNSFRAMSEGFQAIAAEVANYSTKSSREHAAAMQKIAGATSLENAMELQSEYVKEAYQGFVAQATKIGELYVDLAKASYTPSEGVIGEKTSGT